MHKAHLVLWPIIKRQRSVPRARRLVPSSHVLRPMRTTNIGHGVRRSAASVTLPVRNRAKPVRPCVPITIKSILFSAAKWSICSAGSPSTTTCSTGIADPSGGTMRLISSVSRCRYSSGSSCDRACPKETFSGPSVSTACNTMSVDECCFAKSTATSNAIAEHSEKSVGCRIRCGANTSIPQRD